MRLILIDMHCTFMDLRGKAVVPFLVIHKKNATKKKTILSGKEEDRRRESEIKRKKRREWKEEKGWKCTSQHVLRDFPAPQNVVTRKSAGARDEKRGGWGRISLIKQGANATPANIQLIVVRSAPRPLRKCRVEAKGGHKGRGFQDRICRRVVAAQVDSIYRHPPCWSMAFSPHLTRW